MLIQRSEPDGGTRFGTTPKRTDAGTQTSSATFGQRNNHQAHTTLQAVSIVRGTRITILPTAPAGRRPEMIARTHGPFSGGARARGRRSISGRVLLAQRVAAPR
jgi:hypothetical protein